MNFTNQLNRLRTVALGLLAAVFLLSSGGILAQTAYVSAGGSDVTVVDLATGTVVDNISLLGTPRNIVVSPAGDQLATLNDNSVSIIDPATNSVVNELSTTNFNFLGLRDAVFSGGTLVTIDVPTSLIITFDPATLAGPTGFTSTAPGIGPAAIALAPLSGIAFTANAGTNDISPITVAGGAVTAGTPISAGLAPQGIAFLPNQDIAYVANFNDNNVSKIDVASGTTMATIAGVTDPTRLAASPDGSVVLVLEENSASVAVIDVATDAVVTNIPVGNNPFGIDFTEDGSQAIVANQGDASLSVIDLATNTVVNTITGIGGAPSGIVVLGGAAQNEAPVADLVATPTSGDAPLTVDFDASGSTDDGTIVSFDYDFGNGTTGSGETTSTTYTQAGTFLVTLTVTDDEGATGTATVEITVTEPANMAPAANLIATPTSGDAPLTVDFDASGSTDEDGTIVSFDYDFGNGTTG
ncbi:MAG: PKD domain-containing protein, partial [Bacteroidota bacterium]